jgi:hypothetical protein
MSPGDASQFLAETLNNEGVRLGSGEKFSRKTIAGWRHRIDIRGDKPAEQARRKYVRDYLEAHRSFTLKQRKRVVLGAAIGFRGAGFVRTP